jgi:endonuclease III
MSAQEVYDFLTHLPGLGPKSALCVMMYSLDFDVFPVDVHVNRVAARIGAIPSGLKHYQAQQRLPALVPKGLSRKLHIAFVVHGRKICFSKRPACERCPISDLCKHGRNRILSKHD